MCVSITGKLSEILFNKSVFSNPGEKVLKSRKHRREICLVLFTRICDIPGKQLELSFNVVQFSNNGGKVLILVKKILWPGSQNVTDANFGQFWHILEYIFLHFQSFAFFWHSFSNICILKGSLKRKYWFMYKTIVSSIYTIVLNQENMQPPKILTQVYMYL